MADCNNIFVPSEQPGGAISCSQFDTTLAEVKIMCNEINALAPSLLAEYTVLSAASVSLPVVPSSVRAVYIDGQRLSSGDFNVVGVSVNFVGFTVGNSTNGTGNSIVVVEYSA